MAAQGGGRVPMAGAARPAFATERASLRWCRPTNTALLNIGRAAPLSQTEAGGGRCRGSSVAPGAPPPNSMQSHGKYRMAASASPPQTHRAPRASVPAQLSGRSTSSTYAIRAHSPVQSARANCAVTSSHLAAHVSAVSRLSLSPSGRDYGGNHSQTPQPVCSGGSSSGNMHRAAAVSRTLSGTPLCPARDSAACNQPHGAAGEADGGFGGLPGGGTARERRLGGEPTKALHSSGRQSSHSSEMQARQQKTLYVSWKLAPASMGSGI